MRTTSTALSLLAVLGAQDPADSTLQGRIVDVLGEPVPAARVFVLAGGDAVLARTAADGEGLYQVARLPRDAVLSVRVEAPGKVPARAASEPAGRVRLLHFVLEDGAALGGTIRDAAGNPVAGATVVATEGLFTATAASDADGQWRLDAVPVGRLQVRAFGGGRELAETRVAVAADTTCELRLRGDERPPRLLVAVDLPEAARAQAWFEIRSVPAAVQRLPLRADGTAELQVLPFAHEVVLMAPGFQVAPHACRCRYLARDDLEFRVTAVQHPLQTTLRGVLLNPAGGPARGVRVACRNRAGQRVGTVTSGGDGSFALAVPLPAQAHCELGVEVEEWLLAGKGPVRRDADGWTWSALTADPQRTFELRFEPAAALRGRLLDSQGAPLAFAAVQLLWVQDRFPHSGANAQVATDRVGRLDVRGLAPGTYWIVARDLHGNVGEARFAVEPGRATELAALEFTRGGEVRGTVRDAEGRPLAGAVVRAHPGAAAPAHRVFDWTTLTDRQGRYRIAGLPEGAVTVEARERDAPGNSRLALLEATLVAGTTTTADLQAR